MVTLVVWSAAFIQLVRHAGAVRVLVADVTVLTALGLSAPSTVPPSWVASGKSWLLPFLSFSCVALQYYARPLHGALGALVVSGGSLTGTLAALPPGGSSASVVTSVWILVVSLLGRILWTLAARAGRTADAIAADAAEARRNQQVAAVVRTDERALVNALHDTAAATLLMVGVGQVPRTTPTLRRRARRDIEVLDSYGSPHTRTADLVELLRDAVHVVPLQVRLVTPTRVPLRPDVAQALVGAAAEALNNVVKHADTQHVLVTLTAEGAAVNLDVADRGRGLDAHKPPPAGRGLRESIAGRMEEVGGGWSGKSRPGSGTGIHLQWVDRG